MSESIYIPGKPIAKKRPRFVRKGNFVGAYNEQVTEEEHWKIQATQQIKKPLEGALSLDVLFIMPIPKSWPKIRREKAVHFTIWHIKTPDLDNLVKFVKDCLNGLAWYDDKQVAILNAFKRYGPEPGTSITIKQI